MKKTTLAPTLLVSAALAALGAAPARAQSHLPLPPRESDARERPIGESLRAELVETVRRAFPAHHFMRHVPFAVTVTEGGEPARFSITTVGNAVRGATLAVDASVLGAIDAAGRGLPGSSAGGEEVRSRALTLLALDAARRGTADWTERLGPVADLDLRGAARASGLFERALPAPLAGAIGRVLAQANGEGARRLLETIAADARLRAAPVSGAEGELSEDVRRRVAESVRRAFPDHSFMRHVPMEVRLTEGSGEPVTVALNTIGGRVHKALLEIDRGLLASIDRAADGLPGSSVSGEELRSRALTLLALEAAERAAASNHRLAFELDLAGAARESRLFDRAPPRPVEDALRRVLDRTGGHGERALRIVETGINDRLLGETGGAVATAPTTEGETTGGAMSAELRGTLEEGVRRAFPAHHFMRHAPIEVGFAATGEPAKLSITTVGGAVRGARLTIDPALLPAIERASHGLPGASVGGAELRSRALLLLALDAASRAVSTPLDVRGAAQRSGLFEGLPTAQESALRRVLAEAGRGGVLEEVTGTTGRNPGRGRGILPTERGGRIERLLDRARARTRRVRR